MASIKSCPNCGMPKFADRPCAYCPHLPHDKHLPRTAPTLLLVGLFRGRKLYLEATGDPERDDRNTASLEAKLNPLRKSPEDHLADYLAKHEPKRRPWWRFW